MAAQATDQPSCESGPPTLGASYTSLLKQVEEPVKSVPIKPNTYLHGEPQVIWEQEEVKQMIINENQEYAVIEKFSYGWSDIHELRRIILK